MKRKVKKPLYISVIVLLVTISFFGGWSYYKHITSKEDPKAIYLELVETNKDTFKNKLLDFHKPFKEAPFYIEKDEIVITAEGKKLTRAKKIKIFLVHKVVFDGAGRTGASSDYYMFDKIPARIKLKSFTSGKLKLTLDDSTNKTLAIRLLPKILSIIRTNIDRNYVTLKYNDHRTKLSREQQITLNESSKDIQISQEYLAPVLKGKEPSKKDIKIEVDNFGTIKFSTNLSIKNYGSYTVKTYE